MSDEYLFIGGFHHGKRVSVTPGAAICNKMTPEGMQTYARRTMRRIVRDRSTKPATEYLQQAYVFYFDAEDRGAAECEALLLPSDWHEVEGSRRVIVWEKEASGER